MIQTVEVKIDGTFPAILVKEATSSPPSPNNVKMCKMCSTFVEIIPFKFLSATYTYAYANHNKKNRPAELFVFC